MFKTLKQTLLGRNSSAGLVQGSADRYQERRDSKNECDM